MKYPDLEDPMLAEFVGILLGDGMIGKYECDRGDGTYSIQHCVKITLSSEETGYQDYIEDMFSDLFGVKPSCGKRKNENSYDIRCFQKELFEFLVEEVGLKKSPKWEKAEIPNVFLSQENLAKRVLRGYFDTDGSVVLTDNNGVLYPRLEMKICPSPMQDQFIEILDSLGFRFGAYEIGKGKIRIQMNGKTQLAKFENEVGINNPKHVLKAEKVG
ncbi:MAG: hypothetical protein ACI8Z7_000699 [Candidatus Nanohaloarchaea archaeon]|jgi:hypothetical protein